MSKETLTDADIRAFCGNCDALVENPDGTVGCNFLGPKAQADATLRGECGLAIVDDENGKMTTDGFVKKPFEKYTKKHPVRFFF